VSTMLKISEGTVKTHLFRGLRNLRKRLQHLQEEV
jgi:DNA-directed RNA polymerase specialized sigma24 family protein